MPTRRNFLATTHLRTRLLLVMLAAVIALVGAPAAGAATPEAGKPIRIGIIGTGRIGGTLASHWAKAGHEVMLSSRHPEELKDLADSLGRRARVGTPKEAAAFGEVVLISVPYAALPELGRDLSKELAGKIVLETGNPVPRPRRRHGRGGAAQRHRRGVDPEFLPGVKLVRAFNAISYRDLQSLAIAAASGWRFRSPATMPPRWKWRSAWCAMRASSPWSSARSIVRKSSTSARRCT